MKHIVSALTLAIMATSVQASESWFEVELIVFERKDSVTRQPADLAPTLYSGKRAIELINEQLRPTYPACPSLSQRQRFDLSLQALQAQERLLSGQLSPATSELPVVTDAEQLVSEPIAPIKCQAPDEGLLAQAYQVKAQRLKEAALQQALEIEQQAIDGGEQTLASLADTSSDDISASNEPLLNTSAEFDSPDINALTPALPEFDQSVFIEYPTTLVVDDIQYQVMPVQAITARESIPRVISALALPDELNKDHLLTAEQLQMDELRKKMRWQKSLTPILHTGWRQPVFARHLAKPIHLIGGTNYANQYHENGSIISLSGAVLDDNLAPQALPLAGESELLELDQNEFMAPQEPEIVVEPSTVISEIVDELTQALAPPPPAPLWQFDGLLKIYLNRFLFIEADFDLRKPGQAQRLVQTVADDTVDSLPVETSVSLVVNHNQSADMSDSAMTTLNDKPQLETVDWLNSYRLLQHRRVRSKEIHYFDHPNLGMVIQIRRFKVDTDASKK